MRSPSTWKNILPKSLARAVMLFSMTALGIGRRPFLANNGASGIPPQRESMVSRNWSSGTTAPPKMHPVMSSRRSLKIRILSSLSWSNRVFTRFSHRRSVPSGGAKGKSGLWGQLASTPMGGAYSITFSLCLPEAPRRSASGFWPLFSGFNVRICRSRCRCLW